jgi:hypothetical protein
MSSKHPHQHTICVVQHHDSTEMGYCSVPERAAPSKQYVLQGKLMLLSLNSSV